MRFPNTFIVLGSFLITTYAQMQVSVSYDQVYDNAAEPIADIACSNSFGSIISLGQIPAFANVWGFPKSRATFHKVHTNLVQIGGSPTVSGYGSPNCGKCYSLTYQGTTVSKLSYHQYNLNKHIRRLM